MGQRAENHEESDYNRKYYEQHKEKILLKRSSRYSEDPEFKMKRQAYARDRRRIEREVERRKRKGMPPKKRRKGPLPPKVHSIDVNGVDHEVMMYTSGHLAAGLKKSIKTIRAWELKGILPEAMYRGARNMRLYTELQLELILEAYIASMKADKVSTTHRISRSDFPKLVKKIWQDFPLGIDLSR